MTDKSAMQMAGYGTAAPPTTNESVRDPAGGISKGSQTTFASTVGLTLGPSTLLVFCFGIFIGPLLKEFGWSIGAISLGGTILAISNAIATLFAGALVDRIGPRKLVLWTLPVFGAAVAALSFATPDIMVFYVLISVAALLGIGAWPVVYNKAVAGWFDRTLGFNLGLANAGIGIGAALLPVLLAYVIPTYGWRSGYMVLGALALVPWIIAFFTLHDSVAPDRGSSSPATTHLAAAPSLTMQESRATTEFWLIIAGYVALGVASVAIVVHLVRILIDSGLSPAEVAKLQGVLGISLIIGRVCTGWLIDRISATWLMAFFCAAAALALGALGAGAPLAFVPLCVAMIGFVIGAEFDVLGYLIPRYFGRADFGKIYGFNYAVFQFAGAGAVALLGISRGASGSYSFGLYVIGAVLAVGAICFALLPRYRFVPTKIG
jgi:sugar phosphate permease